MSPNVFALNARIVFLTSFRTVKQHTYVPVFQNAHLFFLFKLQIVMMRDKFCNVFIIFTSKNTFDQICYVLYEIVWKLNSKSIWIACEIIQK